MGLGVVLNFFDAGSVLFGMRESKRGRLTSGKVEVRSIDRVTVTFCGSIVKVHTTCRSIGQLRDDSLGTSVFVNGEGQRRSVARRGSIKPKGRSRAPFER